MPQFRKPEADVVSIGIEFCGLGGRIEDTQRLAIHTAACAPLPAAVICCQVAIHLKFHKSPLAPAPVADQVFNQE